MDTEKAHELRQQFRNATERLSEALAREPHDELARDGSIQRFEFTFELAWKVIRAELLDSGIRCEAPRECIRAAFKQGILADDPFWLQMVKMRNLTSHTYIQRIANQVYRQLPDALERFKALQERLS